MLYEVITDPRDLKAGSKVTISYDWKDKSKFVGYEIELDYDKSAIVKRTGDEEFVAEIQKKDFITKRQIGKGEIKSTLYEAVITSYSIHYTKLYDYLFKGGLMSIERIGNTLATATALILSKNL